MMQRRWGPPPASAGPGAGARPGRSRSGVAPLALAALLLLGLLAGSAAPAGSSRTTTSSGLRPELSTLSATVGAAPKEGATPLAVTFTVMAAGGSAPYRYAWDFGDGNASPVADPMHVYTAPGEYVASVTVTDALSETVTVSQTVNATPLPMLVSVVALGDPSDSRAVTTVHANVTGGVPPFLYTWQFGDGTGAVGSSPTVLHTFRSAGSYSMTVRVSDGAGIAASGAAEVQVGPPRAAGPACGGWPAGCGPLGLSLSVWALIAGVTVLAVGGLAWRSRGGARRLSQSSVRGIPPGARAGGSEMTLLRPQGPKDVSTPPAGPRQPAPAASARSNTEEPQTASRPMSERILIHLYRQGVPDPNRAVAAAFTQDGMAVALGRPQSAFARALLRLEESGLVRSELAHVQGRSRRAKTYRLTPQGESAARRLGAAAQTRLDHGASN